MSNSIESYSAHESAGSESIFFETVEALSDQESSNDWDNEVGPGNESNNDQDEVSIRCIRRSIGAVVNNGNVQFFIFILIVVNALMMGLATFNFISENETANHAFEVTDRVFLVIFTVELTMQLIYHGFRFFKDGWLVFDFIIVILSWAFESIQVIRSFRVLRALRLVTRIDAMRNLVLSLFAVIPRMSAIALLLLLVFYIFAVMFTALFKELPLSENYFTRLDNSFFTLFQMMTMEWITITRECMQFYTWAWAPFLAFVMISGFIVFNLIIAVVCDAVSEIENKENKKEEVSCMENEIRVTEKRVDDLSRNLQQLIKNQKEMNSSLGALARDIYTIDKQRNGND
mmetsp:Transcript_22590/g.40769  ORF Transcript_22590/g.40769 Transcript_22590/m.40769 type:complete len:345 (-) Transcript_22590:82-1116(-)|eukprot:CAMPEP_0198283428 /NCGR_PEP_ID=MMETSP1449-20131203/3015_1 /TAXON_ID=420275 /ORGANISM="Attheya septentrionalis, Strain CCMP2084" /LENGTH=344 /DNA_ID=CAMNT_0043980013 /DNA_START=249 /DNA_END=1283 /DNA_ORIENTATION=+